MATSTVGETQVFSPARRWTRYKLDVPVRVITHRSSTSSVINGRGKDISEGGMAIQAEEQMLPGMRCRVRFTLPNDVNPIVSDCLLYTSPSPRD